MAKPKIKITLLFFVLLVAVALLLSSLFLQFKKENKPQKASGESCNDTSECLGKCNYSYNYQENEYSKWAKNYKPGDKFKVSEGQCVDSDQKFGCNTEVKNGYIYSPVLCIDPGPLQ